MISLQRFIIFFKPDDYSSLYSKWLSPIDVHTTPNVVYIIHKLVMLTIHRKYYFDNANRNWYLNILDNYVSIHHVSYMSYNLIAITPSRVSLLIIKKVHIDNIQSYFQPSDYMCLCWLSTSIKDLSFDAFESGDLGLFRSLILFCVPLKYHARGMHLPLDFRLMRDTIMSICYEAIII